MNYGLQLYSVRDVAEKDLELALRQVAEIGYRSVEFAGFFGHTAQQVKEMLNRYGLAVSGTHSGLDDLDQDFKAVVEYHHAIGNTNYIVPWAPSGTKEELYNTVARLNRYAPMLAAEGIRLGYHNHADEYRVNSDGLVAMEVLEKETDVDFEIDTFWVFAAGKDPVGELNRLRHRMNVIHLKDGLADGSGFALGEGAAPVAAVREKAMELGLNIVVESETLQPDGISEVTRCFRYLQTLEK